MLFCIQDTLKGANIVPIGREQSSNRVPSHIFYPNMPFLDALASLGSMLESESVSESLTFLRFGQPLPDIAFRLLFTVP